MFMLNNQRVRLDVDLVVGDGKNAITYPAASLLSPALRAEIGIEEKPDPVRPDDRLFFVSENANGSFSRVPRPREQIAASIWQQIKARRDTVKAGGIKVGEHWFHSDADSRLQHMNLARMADVARQAGASDDTPLCSPVDGQPIAWKTREGTTATMTCKLAYDLVAADAELDLRAHAAAEVHRAAMMKADNPFDYDYMAGWPEGHDAI